MNNKKYLAYFANSADYNINHILVGNPLLLSKLCEEFEKVYLIGFQNLVFFPPKKKENIFKFDKQLKLPKNLELFCPLNWRDFSNFMIDKNLIAIHGFARGFPELKVHLLLKKYKIKFIQVSNIGNIQGVYRSLKGSFLKGLWEKVKHDYSHNLTVLLSNFDLIKKIEIRFVTDSRMLAYRKNNKRFFHKIFNYLNLHFAKELIIVNSRSFDQIKEQNITVSEDLIILLDAPFNNYQYVAWRGILDKKQLDKHYHAMRVFLKNLSSTYNKEVVICIHPTENLEIIKKNYPEFKVLQNQTRENIFKAFIVLFHDSSAVIDAILLKKKIITLTSSLMDQNQIDGIDAYVNRIGMLKLGIDNKMKINKDDLLLKLEENTENYSNYIKSTIAPDGNNIGYEKIIKIIKERFF